MRSENTGNKRKKKTCEGAVEEMLRDYETGLDVVRRSKNANGSKCNEEKRLLWYGHVRGTNASRWIEIVTDWSPKERTNEEIVAK